MRSTWTRQLKNQNFVWVCVFLGFLLWVCVFIFASLCFLGFFDVGCVFSFALGLCFQISGLRELESLRLKFHVYFLSTSAPPAHGNRVS